MPNEMIRRLTARDTRLSGFRFYDLLVHIFVVVLLISNLVGQKICAIPLFDFHGHPVTANISGAQLLFPITYIFGNIFTEVYGYGASRRAIWLGFFSCAILSLMGLFVVWIPASPNWPNQAAFEAVFFTVPRFIVASLIAFWLGEFTNSFTLAKMKLWTDGKWLWTRTVGSTITGQFVDTTIVILIAFGGRTPWGTMLNLIVSGYVGKVLYEVLATPLTYLIVNTLKRTERVDVYDRGTNFNPFARNRSSPATAS
ncbi:MAG: queuosine precursor transporter [Verrucomicrobiota bacterium]|nr:queuosine precursor transporter [Verrucomicrobiota bacterium]